MVEFHSDHFVANFLVLLISLKSARILGRYFDTKMLTKVFGSVAVSRGSFLAMWSFLTWTDSTVIIATSAHKSQD